MQSTQQKHIVATKVNDRPLVTSGMHKLIPYEVSDTFAVKAKDAGKVTEIDTDTGFMIVTYKDTKQDVFDLKPRMNKNSTGGFYTLQPMEPLFKVGQSFKKGDILLKNPKFFNGKKQGDISYTLGTLAKVSLTPTDGTYEDSSMVTTGLAKKMATKVNMKRAITLGPKANLQYLAQEGQPIKTGDPLIIFENEFDDTSVNDLLAKLGDEFEVEIQDMTHKVLKSKYTGTVTKINIYFNHDVSDYSASIQAILLPYISKNEKRYKKLKQLQGMLKDNLPINLDIGAIKKTDQTKIGRTEFDGLLIEMFVEYEDELGVGDKISFSTALKTVVSDVFPKGEEPYSEFRPEEPIDAFLSPLSAVSRMTTDYFSLALTNKVLIELKRSIDDIMKGKK